MIATKQSSESSTVRQEVMEALALIPQMKTLKSESIEIERLGGLTNKNYRLDTPLGRYILRIPGSGTSEYINRSYEAHAAKVTAKIGVNAGVLYFEDATGIMLSNFIDNALTMNEERFKSLGSIRR